MTYSSELLDCTGKPVSITLANELLGSCFIEDCDGVAIRYLCRCWIAGVCLTQSRATTLLCEEHTH